MLDFSHVFSTAANWICSHCLSKFEFEIPFPRLRKPLKRFGKLGNTPTVVSYRMVKIPGRKLNWVAHPKKYIYHSSPFVISCKKSGEIRSAINITQYKQDKLEFNETPAT